MQKLPIDLEAQQATRKDCKFIFLPSLFCSLQRRSKFLNADQRLAGNFVKFSIDRKNADSHLLTTTVYPCRVVVCTNGDTLRTRY